MRFLLLLALCALLQANQQEPGTELPAEGFTLTASTAVVRLKIVQVPEK
jgi:hypothetical protein